MQPWLWMMAVVAGGLRPNLKRAEDFLAPVRKERRGQTLLRPKAVPFLRWRAAVTSHDAETLRRVDQTY